MTFLSHIVTHATDFIRIQLEREKVELESQLMERDGTNAELRDENDELRNHVTKLTNDCATLRKLVDAKDALIRTYRNGNAERAALEAKLVRCFPLWCVEIILIYFIRRQRQRKFRRSSRRRRLVV